MGQLKDRHRKALTALSARTLTLNELRIACKFSSTTVRGVVESLSEMGYTTPPPTERAEAVRLTEKGNEVAAALYLQDLI